MQRRLEFVANLAIVAVALLIGFTLVRQHITSSKSAAGPALLNTPESKLSPGRSLPAPAGYNWGNYPRTLIVALRYGCVHCEHNMELYRRILSATKEEEEPSTHLVSVFPDDAFVAQHDLDEHALHGMPFISNSNFAQLHIFGTPTLLLVNDHGTILQSWIGELSTQQQQEVMETLH